MGVTPVVATLVLVGALLTLSAAAAWRRRAAPAAREFALALGIAALGGFSVAASVGFGLPTAFVVAPTLLVALVLPIPWLTFALAYTGRTELASVRFSALAAVIPGLGVGATAVIFGSRLVPGLRLPAPEAASGLAALAVTFLGLLQWLGLLYAGGLMFVSSGLVLLTYQRYRYLDSTAGLLLGVFGTVPWISLLFGFQVVGVDPRALPWTVAVGFLIGGVAAGVGIRRYRLFSGVPAIGNVGPATVIEELGDGMFVTDDAGVVVEVNPAAEAMVDADAADLVGATVESVLTVPLERLTEVEFLELHTASGRRLFEPTVSELADQHGHRLGHAIVLRDVTERTSRRQRLEVLNRVLGHNLRNRMNVVIGHAEILLAGVDDPDLRRSVEHIIDSSWELIRLSERGKEIEQALAAESAATDEPASLEAVVTAVVETVRRDYPEGTVRTDVPGDVVIDAPGELIELALRHLVENALEHNDAPQPTVEIRASFGSGNFPLSVTVLDDGPGIPESETNVIERGEETDLDHASSLGIWVVRWAVDRLGGTVSFERRDPTGTAVTIDLPGARRVD